MGLSDRDYVRSRGPDSGMLRGPMTAMRMWSVNTWIIAICAAVFVVDGFLIIYVPTGELETPTLKLMDPSILKPGRDVQPQVFQFQTPDGRRMERQTLAQPMIERASGNIVGWREVEPKHLLTEYLHFSTKLGFLQFEWWRFITFQFLHANLTHLVFNMLGLFFFGPLVEQYLGSKRYLAFYLLCGMCGAIMYLILNLAGNVASAYFGVVNIPGLLFSDTMTPLVGASAGIFGVLMAGAYLAPRSTVLLFYVIPMQLRTLAYLLVALALYRVIFGGENAGGEAGHLGGAIAGFYFIRHSHHLHNFFDILGRVDPTSHHYRGDPSRKRPAGILNPQNRQEIDRILDKIKADGLASLSEREKGILRDASRGD